MIGLCRKHRQVRYELHKKFGEEKFKNITRKTWE
jgi:hypothetical protein